jgi:hypothetical protein
MGLIRTTRNLQKQQVLARNKLHKLTVNNLVTMEHKQSKPLLSKAHQTKANINKFKMIEAMRLKIIASRPP